jgi:hypothetical protein
MMSLAGRLGNVDDWELMQMGSKHSLEGTRRPDAGEYDLEAG